MPKEIVENNEELGNQVRGDQQFHETSSNTQNGTPILSLTERIRERDSQEGPSWNHTHP